MMDYISEKQYLRSKWILIIIGIIFIFDMGMAIFLTIMLKQWWIAPIAMLPAIFIAILLYNLSMQILLDKQGILIQIFPFSKKKISWNEIKKINVIHIDPLHFGGWGIKIKPNQAAYLFEGRQGVELILKDNYKIYFTIKDPEAFLKAALQNIK